MTDTETTSLTSWLLAQIAQDEERAASAVGRGIVWPRLADIVAEHDVQSGWHVVRWHPARVLAECEAKRRIVEEHEGDGQLCTGLIDRDDSRACLTLRYLATVYADAPGFREEWRP